MDLPFARIFNDRFRFLFSRSRRDEAPKAKAPKAAAPEREWLIRLPGRRNCITVFARTKSEARALAKQELCLRVRLPIGTVVRHIVSC